MAKNLCYVIINVQYIYQKHFRWSCVSFLIEWGERTDDFNLLSQLFSFISKIGQPTSTNVLWINWRKWIHWNFANIRAKLSPYGNTSIVFIMCTMHFMKDHMYVMKRFMWFVCTFFSCYSIPKWNENVFVVKSQVVLCLKWMKFF